MGKRICFAFDKSWMPDFMSKFYSNISQKLTKCSGWTMEVQQDNDPKHSSHLAKTFLDENSPEAMDWPSNNPNLNPIENLWTIVKGNVEK